MTDVITIEGDVLTITTAERGPQGDTGPQGIQGDTGPQGIQGIQGIQGDTGPQGVQGETGPAGTTLHAELTDTATAGHPIAAITGLQTALDGKEPADATILKDADIDVTVAAFDPDYATNKTKLAGIEDNATADQTASEILTAIKTVDGTTSGLDADLLDGQHGSYYEPADATILKDADIGATIPSIVHEHPTYHASRITQLDAETRVTSLCDVGSGVVLAGTGNGGKIYRSTDYGATWSVVYDSTAALIYSITDLGGGVLIAGSYRVPAEIYRSTDYGATWASVGTLEADINYITSFVHVGGGVVFAGTANDAYIYYSFKSTDYGATWVTVDMSGAVGTGGNVQRLTKTFGGSLLASTNGYMNRSTDSGNSWTAILSAITKSGQIVSLSDGTVIFGRGGNASTIYKSTNDGASFSLIATLPTGAGISSLVATANDDLIAGEGSNLYLSQDGGYTWRVIGTVADDNILALTELDNGKILAGTGNTMADVYSITPGDTFQPATIGWADLISPISTAGVPSASAPTSTAFGPSGLREEHAFAIGDYCFPQPFHVNHDMMPGGKAYVHVHWTTDGVDTNTVRWELQISRALGHAQAAFGAPVSYYVESAGSGTAWQHIVSEVGDSDALTLTEPDELILVTLRRVTNGGTDNADAVFGLTVDFHYQTDRDSTPQKAPDFYA